MTEKQAIGFIIDRHKTIGESALPLAILVAPKVEYQDPSYQAEPEDLEKVYYCLGPEALEECHQEFLEGGFDF